MNILVINGSPKGDKSNSMKLTGAFLEGMGDNEVQIMTVSKMNLASCKGCFCCWNKTPGNCVISDDMKTIIEGERWADIIIWSFPLYYFNVPGLLKNLIDRQLPMLLPFMTDREGNIGSGNHPYRYDMSGKKQILISTCGFYSAENNYDSVRRMFDYICGFEQYESIFCGQGELFGVAELKSRTDEYLALVKRAGSEYVSGAIWADTRNELNEPLYPKDVFEEMADASWGIEKTSGKKEDRSLIFTRQMAALYNKDNFDGKVRVLEICYTDIDKTYQILLDGDGGKVITDGSLKTTTRIDTPWDIWRSISQGEIRGDEALAKGLYKVDGDFSLMINWDKFFGRRVKNTQQNIETNDRKEKKPVMFTMLITWISFWVSVSINAKIGPIVTMLICLAIPLLMAKRRMTIYDKVSIFVVGILSAFAMQDGMTHIAILLGYLCFGLMWLLSCFTKEPLSAAYVKYNYNGDEALKNPIFMKANYILTGGWGILYILTSIWTYFLYKVELSMVAIIINNSIPAVMGIFTVWFERWYPAYVASGRKQISSPY